jgi:hypothetical protein
MNRHDGRDGMGVAADQTETSLNPACEMALVL